MFYPPEVIEEVRTGNDIVDLVSAYVPLKQRGGRFFGLCPFHNEKSPSFSVSPDKQMYHCFGCGASGNAIGFVMQIENHDFPDAIRFLAERIHYTLPEQGSSQEAARAAAVREQLYEINKSAARFFYDTLVNAGDTAVTYLDSRGLGRKIRIKYGLGYADNKWNTMYQHLMYQGYDTDLISESGLVVPDKKGGFRDRFIDRLMFPIFSAQGKIAGFGGRILSDGEPKYLNSPDTRIFDKSKNLYGINFARSSRSRHLIIVEGYMDVLALAQAGFDNAVAALGTAFNKDHVNVLKKYADTVTLLFDSDEAGTKAALRAIPHLTAGGIKTKVLQVADAKDPDEYISKFGGEAFSELLNTAVNYIAFQINCIRKRHDISQTEGRVQFIQEVAKLLAELDSVVEREAYTRETAKTTGISVGAITSEIERYTGKQFETVTVKKRAMRGGGRAVRDAQKEILLLAAGDRRAANAIRRVLQPADILDPIYARLLELIYSTHDSGHDWYPAEAPNFFTETDDQRKAAEVFADDNHMYTDDRSLEVSASDSVRRVKMYSIDKRIAEAVDELELRDLIEIKRKINNLSINLIE